jgi:hypothetical protein
MTDSFRNRFLHFYKRTLNSFRKAKPKASEIFKSMSKTIFSQLGKQKEKNLNSKVFQNIDGRPRYETIMNKNEYEQTVKFKPKNKRVLETSVNSSSGETENKVLVRPKRPPTPPPKPKNIKGFEEFQRNPSSLENPENNYESIKNQHPNLLVNPSSSTV